jgi:T5SS/PEP-CTERM-associated repeat protein
MQELWPRTTHVRSLVIPCRAPSARRRHGPRAAQLAAATALASTLLAGRYASAQTWAAPVSGSWSVLSNWLGGAIPVSSLSTGLRFDASGSDVYTATNDLLPAPFVLNTLDLNNTGSGLITLDGAQLAFDGSNPSIGLSGSGNALVRNPIQLSADTTVTGAGSGTITLQGALTASPPSTRSLIVNAPNGNLVLSGGAALYGLKVNSGNAYLSGGTYTLASAQHGTDPFGNVNDGGFWSMVAGDSAGGVGRLTVSNGAVLNGQNAFVANAPGASGIATFSGPGTIVNLPTTGTEGRLGVNFGTGTVNVLAGAVVNGRRLDIGRQSNSVGYLLVDGAGSAVNASQSFNVPSGAATGTAVISNGATVSIAGGFGFIGAATDASNNPLPSTGAVTVTGANSLLNVGSVGGGNNGQLAIGIGNASVTASGTLSIVAGGRTSAANTLIGRGQGVGRLLLDGAGSRFTNTNEIAITSAAATPSQLSITNGATLSSGNTLFAGIGAGESGLINVTGPGSLATITNATVLGGGGGIGATGGTATVNISSGGELRSDFIQAAENPSGRATVNVDGANSKLTVTDQLIAADDVGATATITVSNGATLAVTSGAFMSPGPGSVSTINITGPGASFASVGTLSELHVGGAFGAAGGTATFNVTNGASANAGRIALVYARGALNVGSGTTPASFTVGSSGLVLDGTVNYNSGTLSSAGTLAVGGSVLLSSAGPGRANKKTLDVASISLTASGVVDLNDNDLISRGSSKAVVQGYINTARHNGAWDLPGITSTAARDNPAHNTTLGVLSGSEYASMNGGTTQFNGRSFAPTNTLVKYTYYGDTDFNGTVNFDDYVRIDNGFNNNLTGWMNGDFDGNGAVNFDDYVLIDLAFNTQGQALARHGASGGGSAGLLERPTLESAISAIAGNIAGPSVAEEKRVSHAQPLGGDHTTDLRARAVPEPTSSGMFGAALLVGTCVPRVRRRWSGGRVGRCRSARRAAGEALGPASSVMS